MAPVADYAADVMCCFLYQQANKVEANSLWNFQAVNHQMLVTYNMHLCCKTSTLDTFENGKQYNTLSYSTIEMKGKLLHIFLQN